ncbi:hypothetical protein GW17_00037917 [Ensete ventricosum]|nr:hypothetical protein GW17_00037917 [Ensete ventricosum]
MGSEPAALVCTTDNCSEVLTAACHSITSGDTKPSRATRNISEPDDALITGEPCVSILLGDFHGVGSGHSLTLLPVAVLLPSAKIFPWQSNVQ